MESLNTLLLFVHAIPRTAEKISMYMDRWNSLFEEYSAKPDAAVCVLSTPSVYMSDLIDMAKAAFGERCFVDPTDESESTMTLIGNDLVRTLSGRGSRDQWIPYEIWTSNNARMWTEGLKREFAEREFEYDENDFEVIACGAQWQGCLTKYAMFMTTYLGSRRPPQVRPDLSHDAGFPLEATFMESHLVADSVALYLFETPDGRPMGQFADLLRPVWEAPHFATFEIDPDKVELISTSPNGFFCVQGRAVKGCDFVVMDVGDGCHGDFSTVVGDRLDYNELKTALLNARIDKLVRPQGPYFAIPYMAPVRMDREGT